ncbi:MAG: GntR family transcriptional regulator [Alphaproteobacteria bacterium]|jgi:DNA-binding GntR family transcriptional regulator|nr:GntR family transcriptional regulator [Alphaproteobacteria bacterium]
MTSSPVLAAIVEKSDTKPRNRREGTPLHEKVYNELRRALIAGRFQPGQVITLRRVAAMLGTSPMPVREALRRLTAEGALVVGPNRSVRVPMITVAGYTEVYEIRIALEGLAAEKAAGRMSEAELDRLQAVNQAFRDAAENNDAEGYLENNQEFHLSIYRAAGSTLLVDTIEGLWLRVGPILHYLFRDVGLVNAAVETHTPILDALRRHDGPAARAAVANDIHHAALHLTDWLLPKDSAGSQD